MITVLLFFIEDHFEDCADGNGGSNDNLGG